MRPLETLASVTTPEGRLLALFRRNDDYYIHLDGEELMSTRRHGSEAALAELALGKLTAGSAPRVLIGGLGLGYTLRAALETLPRDARVVVAEIFPAVVAWNRELLVGLGQPLDDPRVTVIEADVAAVLDERGAAAWDAVLLDVDNGPSAWCLGSNRRLYDRKGLEDLREALRPGGVLGVWSAFRDDGFSKLLGQVGFDARVEIVRAHEGRGAKGYLYFARRGAGEQGSRRRRRRS
jgi:spermidine synthase